LPEFRNLYIIAQVGGSTNGAAVYKKIIYAVHHEEYHIGYKGGDGVSKEPDQIFFSREPE
jgi:hypothetical protein